MAFPKHDRAIAQAKKDLAAGTQEVPPGTNTGPRVREMQAHTWLGGTRWPWCVAACITWAEEAGFKLPYQGAGAYAYHAWAKKAGWLVPMKKAIPGDFVVFNIGSGHIAMLEKPIVGSQVTTIGGNESHKVKRSTRNTSLIREGTIVHLPETLIKPPPAKPPLFEVVTSESGHKVIYASNANKIGKRLPGFLKKHKGLTIRRKKKKT
jgi:hypothetical protein